jgi:hypothetical protein
MNGTISTIRFYMSRPEERSCGIYLLDQYGRLRLLPTELHNLGMAFLPDCLDLYNGSESSF